MSRVYTYIVCFVVRCNLCTGLNKSKLCSVLCINSLHIAIEELFTLEGDY